MARLDSALLRDKSRNRFIHGWRICPVCQSPYPFYNATKQFCGARCRQRRHRGHVTIATVRRSALFIARGHLSDRPDDSL